MDMWRSCGQYTLPDVFGGETHIRVMQSSDENWDNAVLAQSENVAAATRKDQEFLGHYPVAARTKAGAERAIDELQSVDREFGRVGYAYFGVIDHGIHETWMDIWLIGVRPECIGTNRFDDNMLTGEVIGPTENLKEPSLNSHIAQFFISPVQATQKTTSVKHHAFQVFACQSHLLVSWLIQELFFSVSRIHLWRQSAKPADRRTILLDRPWISFVKGIFITGWGIYSFATNYHQMVIHPPFQIVA